MKRVKFIEVENFKVFKDNFRIDLNGQHLLVFGTNGSGKSSLFYALYTIFEAAAKKEDNELNKYFIYGGDESLLNSFASETANSFISCSLQEGIGVNPELTKYSLIKGNYSIRGNSDIREMNSGSAFITHRLLQSFYHFAHGDEINLWWVFYNQIFPYVNYKSQYLSDEFDSLGFIVNKERINKVRDRLTEFNLAISDLIVTLNNGVSDFLKEHFYKDAFIKVTFEYATKVLDIQNPGSDLIDRKLNIPLLRMFVQMKRTDGSLYNINRPQSYLNESILNAIAIAIRFVVLEDKGDTKQARILALDDLLISLDMENRMKVIRFLLKTYSPKYQLFVFTHDRGFFQIIQNELNYDIGNWKIIEFNKKAYGSNPKIKDSEGNLSIAQTEFENHRYDACAAYLRKEVELIVKSVTDFWDKGQFQELSKMLNMIKDNYREQNYRQLELILSKELPDKFIEKLDLKIDIEKDNDFLVLNKKEQDQIKKTITNFRNAIVNFVIKILKDNHPKKDLNKMIEQIKNIKDRVLNPGSHASEAPLFEGELQEAIEKVKELREWFDAKKKLEFEPKT